MFDLAACPAAYPVIVIEAPEGTVVDSVLEELADPFQPLREQLMAITGLGLAPDDDLPPVPVERSAVEVPAMGLTLSYLSAASPRGGSADARILFIHGSPGEAEEWREMLVRSWKGQERLAVDRPGFGQTMPAAAMPRLADQAAALRPLIEGSDGTILVGYSYGAPVALRAALDMPEAVSGLLLIGGAADPAEEEVHPLQMLLEREPFADLLPEDLAHANSELLALGEELDAMAGALAEISVPVILMHGLEDTLVAPQNVIYLSAHLEQADPLTIVLIEEGDHFLPWSHVDQINAALACLVHEVRTGR